MPVFDDLDHFRTHTIGPISFIFTDRRLFLPPNKQYYENKVKILKTLAVTREINKSPIGMMASTFAHSPPDA